VVRAVLDGRVPATVSAIREQVQLDRGRRLAGRASRELGELLWALPDRVEDAAEVLADIIVTEGADDESFLSWARSMMVRTLELLGEVAP